MTVQLYRQYYIPPEIMITLTRSQITREMPDPEPPTHTPMVLMAAFAVLAGAGVVYALITRASLKSVFHPKVWLSIFGIPFSILPILS